jgi:hypothetical protein
MRGLGAFPSLPQNILGITNPGKVVYRSTAMLHNTFQTNFTKGMKARKGSGVC